MCVAKYETSSQVIRNALLHNVYITALCVTFLIKLRWPKIINDSKSAAWICPYLIISNLHFHCFNSLNSLVRDLIFSGGLFAPSIG